MGLVMPSRFSRGWWLAIAATTLAIGVAALLVLVSGAGLSLEELVVFWLVATFVGDLLTALAMEAAAPTRLTLAPGERRLDSDRALEVATVISGFGASGIGRVRIRGETWRARPAHDDRRALEAGARVRILEREGLTLVVDTADPARERSGDSS